MALRVNNGVTNERATFDGAGTGITVDSTTDWGMCCWIYRDTDSGTNDHPAGVYTATSGDIPGIGFKCRSNDNYAVWHSTDGDYELTAAAASWIFIAYRTTSVFDGNGYYGTTTTTTEVGGPVNQNQVFDCIVLGSHPNTGNPFSGRIAHFRVWSGGTAPTKAEFEAEMVSATAVRTSGLWAAYEFANDSGTYLNDSSGNARHLTGTNLDFATNYIAGPISSSSSVVPGIWLSRQNRAFGSARQRYT
jgi:hypothetical protein